MTHYAVTCVIKDHHRNLKSEEDIEQAVREMLEPYQEEPLPQYLEKEYISEEEERELWVTWNRSRDVFPPFGEFMGDDGYSFDSSVCRYYYERNPNAKWDWYEIGGRWSGNFPTLKEDYKVDVVRVIDLDWMEVYRETRNKAFEFWCDWRISTTHHKEVMGERGEKYLFGIDYHVRQYNIEGKSPSDFLDFEHFFREYGVQFSIISSYAFLDRNGWHTPGIMGWFGCASSTPSEELEFQKLYLEYLKHLLPSTILVLVDCHT